MSLAHELFRTAGLRPVATESRTGKCCLPVPTTLYRRGSGKETQWLCDVCYTLTQSYPYPAQIKGPQRLIDGSYLLITPETIDFWGAQTLKDHNPSIRHHSATGEMSAATARLIVQPPPTPWMFVAFSKTSVRGDDLMVTTDNTRLQFSGKMPRRIKVVNRSQVMALLAADLTEKQWRAFYKSYVDGSHAAVQTMQTMTTDHPALATLCIPPMYSDEHSAIQMILQTEEQRAV